MEDTSTSESSRVDMNSRRKKLLLVGIFCGALVITSVVLEVTVGSRIVKNAAITPLNLDSETVQFSTPLPTPSPTNAPTNAPTFQPKKSLTTAPATSE